MTRRTEKLSHMQDSRGNTNSVTSPEEACTYDLKEADGSGSTGVGEVGVSCLTLMQMCRLVWGRVTASWEDTWRMTGFDSIHCRNVLPGIRDISDFVQ